MIDLVHSIVFSAGAIQGLLLIVVLLRKKSLVYPNFLLTLLISVVTLQAIFKLLDLHYYAGLLGPVYSIFYYLPYLYGPIIFLYIKSCCAANFKLRFRDIVHFLPFLICVIIALITGYKLINLFDYIDNFIYNVTDTFVQLAVLNIYVLASKKYFKRNIVVNGKIAFSKNTEKWFNSLVNAVWISGVIFIILLTLIFYSVELYDLKSAELNSVFLILPAIIFWISYKALDTPELFAVSNLVPAEISDGHPYVKYQNNRITNAEISDILNKVNIYVSAERGFLDPELSLEGLSKALNIPRHQISQAINAKLRMNFNDLINLNRLEYAKTELVNPEKQNLTIAAIAFESGFNSISTFNESFKRHTSMTPSQFKKNKSLNGA